MPKASARPVTLAGGGFAVVRVFVVLIVLADVDHRQFPERRHVHRLVKQSLPERAVAEEADRDLIGAAHLDRHRRAGGDAGAAADDGIGAQVAGVLVGDVHGAAFAAAIAGFLAEQFGKHSVQRRALGDTVAVAAVGAGDVIVLAQRFANADRDGFLADIEMRETRHLGAEIKLVDLFFEEPDLQHLAVELEPALVVSAGGSFVEFLRWCFYGASHSGIFCVFEFLVLGS